eukprot:1161896-Pelagomonas_calceolata.AAC.3
MKEVAVAVVHADAEAHARVFQQFCCMVQSQHLGSRCARAHTHTHTRTHTTDPCINDEFIERKIACVCDGSGSNRLWQAPMWSVDSLEGMTRHWVVWSWGLLVIKVLSRERTETALAAYSRERRRNTELVHRLQQMHSEQVDVLEMKKRCGALEKELLFLRDKMKTRGCMASDKMHSEQGNVWCFGILGKVAFNACSSLVCDAALIMMCRPASIRMF